MAVNEAEVDRGAVAVDRTVDEILDGMARMTAVAAGEIKKELDSRAAAAAEVARQQSKIEAHDSRVDYLTAQIMERRRAVSFAAENLYREGALSVGEYLRLASIGTCREPEISPRKLALIAREAAVFDGVHGKPRPMVIQNGSSLTACTTTSHKPEVQEGGSVVVLVDIPARGIKGVTINPANFVDAMGEMPTHGMHIGTEAIRDMCVIYALDRMKNGQITQNLAGLVNELAGVGIDPNNLGIPEELLERVLDDLYERVADVKLDDVDGTVRAISHLDKRSVAEVKASIEEAIVNGLADSISDGSSYSLYIVKSKAHSLLSDGGDEPPALAAVEIKASDLQDSAKRLAGKGNSLEVVS